jgi:predicted outer membrane repeat protein
MKFTRNCLYFALTMGLLSQAHAVCYVRGDAVGSNSGASWKNAYIDLQSALTNPACTEVRVAQGVYKPTTDADVLVTFNITPGVKVLGGYAGKGLLPNSRDPKTFVTVLSGDIDNDDANFHTTQIDANTDDIHGNNAYHVVLMNGTLGTAIDNTTVLDGVTITGGNAMDVDRTRHLAAAGGGLYCKGSKVGNGCSPSVNDVIFSGNYADSWGGAMFIDGTNNGTANPTISNAVFRGNKVTYDYGAGGAIFSWCENGTDCHPKLSHVAFIANSAYSGGAIATDAIGGVASPWLDNVLFDSNIAIDAGGAMDDDGSVGVCNPVLEAVTFVNNSAPHGGALYGRSEDGTHVAIMSNVTFANNKADQGGAIFNNGSALLENVTFSGNQATSNGGAIYNAGADSEASILSNVILWGDIAVDGMEIADAGAGDTMSFDHSVIQGGCPAGATCSDIIVADPQLNPLANYGGFTPTMQLRKGSSALNAGDDAGCPTTDQRGFSRPQGAHCDIGAFERLSFF